MAVPAAQAFPDEGSGSVASQQGGLPLQGDDKADIGATTSRVVIVGDDKRGLPVAGTAPVVSEPASYSDIGAQAALRATTRDYVAGAAPVVSEPVQVVSAPSDGFSWGDAGIGAGTMLGVMLLGAGAVLATRRVGHPASV